jgi:hypothetical protein
MSGSGELPIDEGFLLTLPAYTFLAGVGPGYLRDPRSGRQFAPIWTDWDLFQTYIEAMQGPGECRVLVLETRKDFESYLRLLRPDVQGVVIDRSPKPSLATTIIPLSGLRISPG